MSAVDRMLESACKVGRYAKAGSALRGFRELMHRAGAATKTLREGKAAVPDVVHLARERPGDLEFAVRYSLVLEERGRRRRLRRTRLPENPDYYRDDDPADNPEDYYRDDDPDDADYREGRHDAPDRKPPVYREELFVSVYEPVPMDIVMSRVHGRKCKYWTVHGFPKSYVTYIGEPGEPDSDPRNGPADADLVLMLDVLHYLRTRHPAMFPDLFEIHTGGWPVPKTLREARLFKRFHIKNTK